MLDLFSFLPGGTQRPAQPQPQNGMPDLAAFMTALKDLYQRDPLGTTARQNSRPGGLTPQSAWDTMFAPTSPERQAQMTNHAQLSPFQVQQQMNRAGQSYSQPLGTVLDSGAQPAQFNGMRTPGPGGSADIVIDRRYQMEGASPLGVYQPAPAVAAAGSPLPQFDWGSILSKMFV